ncbi:MAG: TonB-dependent receptor [Mangrovibacterium sp.]
MIHAAANVSYSQVAKINLTLSNVDLKEVVNEIQSQTEFTFIYSPDDVAGMKKISIDAKDANIETVLSQCLKETDLEYVVKEKAIVLKKAEKPEWTNQSAVKRMSGTVLDASGQPIPGVTLVVKGTQQGTLTDIDGKFTIEVTVGQALVVSFVGYKTQEVLITDQARLTITLKEDLTELEDVVVVGYGNQKRESVIGAITTLDADNLKIPGSSVSNALAGQLAGVIAMTKSGEPGKNGAAEFYIRGVSSFKGTSTPLVLVDGIERDLDLVDTEDIATFSILKDASASAVYGMRGANGVIIITTKSGKKGKPEVSVRGEAGMTSPTVMPKFVNSAQWAEMYNEAVGSSYYSDEVIAKYKSGEDPDLYPDVNWIDEMYNKFAKNQRVNVNISGGGDISSFYIAGSYYNESSIFKDAGDIYDYKTSINYNKFNFRANLDLQLTNSTKLNLNLANIYEKSFRPARSTSDIWSYTFLTSPNAFPVEYSDGTIAAPSTDSGYNPWNILVHSGYAEQFWNSSQSLLGLTQDFGKLWHPLEGLTGNVKFSWDAWNTTTQTRSKEPTQYHATGRDEDGNLVYGSPIRTGSQELSYSKSTDGTMTTYLEGSLTYNRLFGNTHRVGGLFLYNQKVHSKTQQSDKFLSLPYKSQGVAGRVTYAYNDTYFAEVNMGYNGSENFARGHRFGFFPAIAIGWMVTNEQWFEPLTNVVNLLKLKASYGKVGSDDIGGSRRWIYESTITTVADGDTWNYGVAGGNSGSGLQVGDVENLNVSWEEALKTNIGLEISLLNKVRIQADYFREERTGIFLQRDGLPAIAGLSAIPYTNIGETLNQGFDGTLEYSQQVGEVFLTARGSFTYSRNKLLNNDQPDWEYKYQNKIGKPFGAGNDQFQPFGLVALGLFQSEDEIANSPTQTYGEYRVGDIKYQDVNGDGKIDSYDRIAVGYTNLPEMVYGFGATAQWKNWDINVFFQGVANTSFFLSGSSMRPFSSGNLERSAINEDLYGKTWMTTNTAAQNTAAIYPRLSTGGAAGSSNNSQNSTWNLRSGNYTRLKNFELGYTFSKSLMNKTFVKSLRIYASGNNLLTFSNFKLWDPEQLSGDGSGYPPSRMMIIGLNANF